MARSLSCRSDSPGLGFNVGIRWKKLCIIISYFGWIVKEVTRWLEWYNVDMNKEEFIAKLEEIGWPREEFAILSGGSLLMRGLRETTADLDLCITKRLAEEIKLYDSPKDEKGLYSPYENVQATDDFGRVEYDLVDGYQCETLESVLEFKRRMGRPKDLKDIKRIEEALKGV